MLPQTTVAIIGGGLAGLYAGRLLHRAGIDFQLLEARDRLGGRILSTDKAGRPSDDGFDLGPSWFWPSIQPAMKALVEELKLATFAQYADGDIVFEPVSSEGPQRFQVHQDQPQSMRFVGGTDALVKALVQQLPPARLHVGASVEGFSLERGKVTLRVHRTGKSADPLEARYIIIALPPRLLEATVSFSPAIDPAAVHRWRETPTWMASHAKFVAVYERPFWRDVGLSGMAQSMVGPLVEIHDATTASNAAALFGFFGVNAHQRHSLGEPALRRACLDQLSRLFGPEAHRPITSLLKDWAADPLTATMADRSAAGHPTPKDRSWVTGPWRRHLCFGGSETSVIAPGYLLGAIDAAQRAVEEALESLR